MDYGGKVAFDLHGSQVIVSKAEDSLHEDPAIERFLELLEIDIRNGQNLTGLPKELADAMLAKSADAIDTNAEIDGDVEL